MMEKNFKDLIICRHELLRVLGKGEKKWWETEKPAVKHSFTWKNLLSTRPSLGPRSQREIQMYFPQNF